jgi:hypothetical protein
MKPYASSVGTYAASVGTYDPSVGFYAPKGDIPALGRTFIPGDRLFLFNSIR